MHDDVLCNGVKLGLQNVHGHETIESKLKRSSENNIIEDIDLTFQSS